MRRLLVLRALLFMCILSDVEAGMGVSYEQVTQQLGHSFSMNRSSPVNGQERILGMTNDNLAILEIIGDRADISQASLIIALPKDAITILVRNTELLVRFLRNTAPEWKGSEDWATRAINDFSSSSEGTSTERGGKAFTIRFFKPLGLIVTTVKER